jgi:hypothetical protein
VPEGVALPPGLGAEVPPFGVVVAVLVDWVGVVATVDCVVVAIGSMGAVVLELLFELSPTTMIRPTTSPITTATSPLGPHPAAGGPTSSTQYLATEYRFSGDENPPRKLTSGSRPTVG